MRQQRSPDIGEMLTLTKDPQKYVFFHSEQRPTDDLIIGVGWLLEFSEPLTYQNGDSTYKTSGRRARLMEEGEFAVLVLLDDTEHIRLEDVVVHQKLRAKVISYT